MQRSRWVVGRIALLVLCGIVGVTVALQVQDSPFGQHPILDEKMYVDWARLIAGGQVIGHEAFFFDPLYAYGLAGLFTVFKGSVLAARVGQALLAVGTCALIISSASRLFGRGPGLLAGALFVLYGPAAFETAFLLKEGLLMHLTAWSIWLSIEPTRSRSFVLLGLVLGALALVRGNFLVLLPLTLGWAVWLRRPRRLQVCALLLLGMLLPLGLSSAHNWVAARTWMPTTTHGGPNFFIGNNAQATGSYTVPEGVRPGTQWEVTDFQSLAQRRVGHALTRAQVSSYWFAQGLAFWREQPLDAVKLMVRKAWLLVHRYEIPDNYDYECVRDEWVPTLRGLFLNFGWLFGAAASGLVFAWRTERRAVFAAVLLVGYSGTVLMSFLLDRYRAPMVPLAILFCAAFAQQVTRWVAAREAAALVVAGVCLVVAAVVSFWPSPFSRLAGQHEARCLHLAGMALEDDERWPEAIGYLERSATLAPEQNDSLYNLGRAYQLVGRVEDAKPLYQHILARHDHPRASYNLGLICLAQGHREEALKRFLDARNGGLDTANVEGSIGLAYAGMEQWSLAFDAYHRAYAIDSTLDLIRRGLLEAALRTEHCHEASTLMHDPPQSQQYAALFAQHCSTSGEQ